MTKILDFEPREFRAIRKEMGAGILKLIFMTNARIVSQAYGVNPDVLISDYANTPPEPRTVFWMQVKAVIESVKLVYSFSEAECYTVLGDVIADLLEPPILESQE